jgi:hypothetical protein
VEVSHFPNPRRSGLALNEISMPFVRTADADLILAARGADEGKAI